MKPTFAALLFLAASASMPALAYDGGFSEAINEVKKKQQEILAERAKMLERHKSILRCVTKGADGPMVIQKDDPTAEEKKAITSAHCPQRLWDQYFFGHTASNPYDDKTWPSGCSRTYLALFGEDTYFDTVPNLNRYIVDSMAAELGHRKVKVSEPKHRYPICRKPDVYPAGHVGYTAWTDDKGFHVGLGIDVMGHDSFLAKVFSQDKGRGHKMFMALYGCTGKVASVWRRYGVKMDLPLYFEVNSGRATEDDRIEKPYPTGEWDMLDGYGRADSATLYHGGQSPEMQRCVEDCKAKHAADPGKLPSCFIDECLIPKPEPALCGTLLHEVGHHLGFPDEYIDVQCPDRSFLASEKNPTSVMNDHFVADTEFFPRHILSLLDPLCRQ